MVGARLYHQICRKHCAKMPNGRERDRDIDRQTEGSETDKRVEENEKHYSTKHG